MSYANGNLIKYTTGALLNFASADASFYFIGPKGKKGRIVDYGVEAVSVTFAGATLPGLISVGSAASATAYGASLNVAGVAADAGGKSVKSTYNKPGDVDDYILNGDLPADTKFRLFCRAPTGSGAAGTAIGFVIVNWEL